MPEIVLTKEQEVGIAKIDEQHRVLLNKVNDLIEMGPQAFSSEEIQKTLDLLGNYVIEHFADEEELQIQCGYPEYETHKKQHQDFIEELTKVKNKYPSEGITFQFVLNLMKMITTWALKHIADSDVAFGRYYREKMGV